ncbi:hypothetical protein Tco_0287474 [Tanacetum coccineum]
MKGSSKRAKRCNSEPDRLSFITKKRIHVPLHHPQETPTDLPIVNVIEESLLQYVLPALLLMFLKEATKVAHEAANRWTGLTSLLIYIKVLVSTQLFTISSQCISGAQTIPIWPKNNLNTCTMRALAPVKARMPDIKPGSIIPHQLEVETVVDMPVFGTVLQNEGRAHHVMDELHFLFYFFRCQLVSAAHFISTAGAYHYVDFWLTS